MVAYRLHFEPANLSSIERIRSGTLGDIILFTSTFVQKVDSANHRARNGIAAGPLFDMGPYPLNAARYIFEAEPVEVISAMGVPTAVAARCSIAASPTLFPRFR
jgi:predicted dehydrogenase